MFRGSLSHLSFFLELRFGSDRIKMKEVLIRRLNGAALQTLSPMR